MAKKLVIDLDPQGPVTFTRSIRIPTGDGKPLAVDFDFLFRDRVEMADLLQKWDDAVDAARTKAQAEVKAAAEAADLRTVGDPPLEPPARPDLRTLTEEGITSDVQTLMDFITGWGISNHEFNAENLAKFVRRYPGAPLALVKDYREGMTQGRLGN